MRTDLEIDSKSEIQEDYSNLFGISLRSKRRVQQLAELDKQAEEKGISREALQTELKKEVASNEGDKSKAISNVFDKLATGFLTTASKFAPKPETEEEALAKGNEVGKDEAKLDTNVKILGMKPLVAVGVGLLVAGGIVTTLVILSKKK